MGKAKFNKDKVEDQTMAGRSKTTGADRTTGHQTVLLKERGFFSTTSVENTQVE